MSGDASAILWADWNDSLLRFCLGFGDASAILWADWNVFSASNCWFEVTLVPFCGLTGTCPECGEDHVW